MNFCTPITVCSVVEKTNNPHEQERNKENNNLTSNQENIANNLNQFLTLPEQYLPKTKKEKLKSRGKRKVPAVGTSDKWYKIHLAKENDRKVKEEKLAEKKKLQEEKKLLADKKKELDLQMKKIQKKIKQKKA